MIRHGKKNMDKSAYAFILLLTFAWTALGQEQFPIDSIKGELARERLNWLFSERAYPWGFIPSEARLKALQEIERLELMRLLDQGNQSVTLPLAAWRLIGPQPTNTPYNVPVETGRVSALAVDPRNSNVVYLGATIGGVWKTTDGGQTWTPISDFEASLSIGAIVLDPANPDIVYVGTGDLSSFYGAGLLKSTNGGLTWTNVPGPFVGPFGSDSFFGSSARIVSLAIHPTNSQILLANTWRWPADQAGVFRSADAGLTWTRVLPGPGNDVLFDPTNGNVAYAAMGHYYGYAGSGVYRSTDAGQTWTLANGTGGDVLPPQSNIGTMRLALAPSQPSRLYTFMQQRGSWAPLGLYRTLDSGAHWTRLPNPPQNCCMPLAVLPTNPDVVYGGGARPSVHRSLDGGQTWSNVSVTDGWRWLHDDAHSFAFSNGASKLYAGNDGGVSSTTDVSGTPVSWTDLNETLSITTFYPGLSMDPSDPTFALSGAQDTGVQRYYGILPWFHVDCGDGGMTAVDFVTPTTVYCTCQAMVGILKSTMSGDAFTWNRVMSGINTNDRVAWIPPFVMDPSNSQTLYFGTYRVYRTTNGAALWTPISSDLTGGSWYTIRAIGVARTDFKTVYTGSNDGKVFVTTNADQTPATWTNITAGLPPRAVTQIAVDSYDSQIAYVTFSGFSGFSGDTQGHVFQTLNGGTTWTDISGNPPNALPNIPVNDIVVDPDIANTVYVGTDAGVFGTSDGGNTWTVLGTGLPRTQIMGLKLHQATRIVRAASYGRSAWDLDVPVPAP